MVLKYVNATSDYFYHHLFCWLLIWAMKPFNKAQVTSYILSAPIYYIIRLYI